MDLKYIPRPPANSDSPYQLTHCPSRASCYMRFATIDGVDYYHYVNYSLNQRLPTTGGVYYVKTSVIGSPSSTIMLGDAGVRTDWTVTQGGSGNYMRGNYYLYRKEINPPAGYSPVDEGLDARHSKGANVACYDGRATSVTKGNIGSYYLKSDKSY